LVIGAFLRDDLFLVYVSIASCLAAGLFLVIGIIRSRPSRKPVLASGGNGQDASWSGASTWGGDGRDGAEATAGTQVLDRDEGAAGAPAVDVVPAAEVTDTPTTDTPAADVPAEDDRWAPRAAEPEPEPAAPPASGSTAMSDADEPAADRDTGEAPAAAKAASQAARSKTAGRAGSLPPGFEVLNEVSGVGPAKRQTLAAHYPTIEELRAASAEDLAAIPGISATLAQRIHDHLQF
jgi:hypothetical protein